MTAKRPTRRLLHTSDVHVGCDTSSSTTCDRGFNCLRKVIDLGVQLQVDLLVIAGDLFDNIRVKPDLIAAVGECLSCSGLRTVILPGNHDPHVDGAIYSAHRRVFSEHIHVFSESNGEILLLRNINMQVWGRANVSFDDHTPLYPPPSWQDKGQAARELWRVAVGHGLYYGGVADDHRSYLIHDEHLVDVDADYIALGHLEAHAPVGPSDVVAYYSGSPDRSGGATLIELADAAVTVRHLNFADPVDIAARRIQDLSS